MKIVKLLFFVFQVSFCFASKQLIIDPSIDIFPEDSSRYSGIDRKIYDARHLLRVNNSSLALVQLSALKENGNLADSLRQIIDLNLAYAYLDLKFAGKARIIIEKLLKQQLQNSSLKIHVFTFDLKCLLHRGIDVSSYIDTLESMLSICKDKMDSVSVMNRLASLYGTKGAVEQSEWYLQMIIDIGSKMGYQESATFLGNFGLLKMKQQQYDSALYYLDKARLLLQERGYFGSLKNNYWNSAFICRSKGDFQAATEFLLKHDSLRSLIQIRDKTDYIAEMEVKYAIKQKEIELKDKEAALAQQKATNLLMFLIFTVALIIILIVLFAYIHYNQKLKLKQSKQEVTLQKQKAEHDEAVLASLFKGQEIERNRISKALHDSLGATLSMIKLGIDSGIEREKIKEQMDDSIDEVRRISQALSSGVLERYGLKKSLLDLCDRVSNYHELKIHAQLLIEQLDSHSDDLHIYRIIQELLNNTIKHSNAKNIHLYINKENGKFYLHYNDDGSIWKEKPNNQGMGLTNIQHRANQLKATVNINTENGFALTLQYKLKTT